MKASLNTAELEKGAESVWTAKKAEEAICGEQYGEVTGRILRQLLEALLFEKVLTAEKTQMNGSVRFAIPFTDEAGHAVTYICYGEERYTFGRVRLNRDPIIRITAEGEAVANSLSQFLLDASAAIGGNPSLIASFAHELEQTLLNDVLAQHERMKTDAALSQCSYDELESAVMDGHLYHPSYKSRLGFDYEEQYRYGPEFGRGLRPIWLAVSKEAVMLAQSCRLSSEWLAEEIGRERWSFFLNELRDMGLNSENYVLVPVHPWQWKHRIVPYFHRDIHYGLIVRLGESEEAYIPQQSIRTLANSDSPKKAYLKLSMNIVNTSTGRVLAPHTVENAPLISDWLSSIIESDLYLREDLQLSILEEFAGASYQSPFSSEALSSLTYGSLGCIWRSSLHTKLKAGESACGFTALCAVGPDGIPYIDGWIRQYGAEEWTEQLLEQSVRPIIHLLYAHGIAFESHAQNLILIHREGRPLRLAMKDFHDGIKFSRSHLSSPALCPELQATPAAHARVNRNSFIETDDTVHIKDLVLGAFFFINLGELAIFLADRYGYSEQRFWQTARGIIERYQEQFPHLSDRYRTFDLLSPTNELEQLAKRRLFTESEIRVHQVQNPLSYRPGKE
ncbi:IucA/IucC family protein [Paenibacillus sp. M.A.Huq-81]